MKTTTLPVTTMRRWTRADYDRLIDHEYRTRLDARATVPGCWIVDLVHATVEVPRLVPDRSIAAAALLP